VNNFSILHIFLNDIVNVDKDCYSSMSPSDWHELGFVYDSFTFEAQCYPFVILQEMYDQYLKLRKGPYLGEIDQIKSTVCNFDTVEDQFIQNVTSHIKEASEDEDDASDEEPVPAAKENLSVSLPFRFPDMSEEWTTELRKYITVDQQQDEDIPKSLILQFRQFIDKDNKKRKLTPTKISEEYLAALVIHLLEVDFFPWRITGSWINNWGYCYYFSDYRLKSAHF
jgi:hypothetical protein